MVVGGKRSAPIPDRARALDLVLGAFCGIRSSSSSSASKTLVAAGRLAAVRVGWKELEDAEGLAAFPRENLIPDMLMMKSDENTAETSWSVTVHGKESATERKLAAVIQYMYCNGESITVLYCIL